MNPTLIALADGNRMGVVELQNDRLSFRYDANWQSSETAYPLSFSMPISASEHGQTLAASLPVHVEERLGKWGGSDETIPTTRASR